MYGGWGWLSVWWVGMVEWMVGECGKVDGV